ncbi:hypothetical protein [Dapis sp. BLCC M229]|uniref:hypothetical protein n=1 Tax=Dapis sp. BLCC M229 TaxID=3400188 RepID=UPI003CEDAB77
MVLGAHDAVNLEGSGDKDYQYGTQFDDVFVGHELSNSYSATSLANLDSHDGDIMYGFGGNDEFSGGKGGDHIDGGDGSDTANYILSPNPISVNLSNLTNDGYAEADDGFSNIDDAKDRLYSIENIIGSDQNDADGNGDSITGDAKANILKGMGGKDSLEGGYGDDILTGGAEADQFILNALSTDTITDFNRNEGDIIKINKSAYGINRLSDLSFNSRTGELTASTVEDPIAILENPVRFAVNSTNISLFAAEVDPNPNTPSTPGTPSIPTTPTIPGFGDLFPDIDLDFGGSNNPFSFL